jgi:carboxyl-terminal processing protease
MPDQSREAGSGGRGAGDDSVAMTKRLIGMAAVAGVLAVAAVGARKAPGDESIFNQVIQRVRESGVDSLGDSTLFLKAARGLVYELNDPYAQLFSPEQWDQFIRNSLGNDYAGLGIAIEQLSDSVTVTGVFPGTPAARAGVQRGDRLLMVDSTSVIKWTTDQVSHRLMGPEGSTVTVTLARAGAASPITVQLARAVVHTPSVPYTLMFDGHVGYLPLIRVSGNATADVRAALLRLREAGATSFILDLRGDPGGELGQSLAVSNLFLERGQVLATVRSRSAPPETYTASSRPVLVESPVVVLEDGYTASAAEIIAGALQDHDRALVVGMPSYGKGLVQSSFPLSGGWELKMTTGRWYTPSGRSIHRTREYADGRFVHPDSEPGRSPDSIRAGRPIVHSDAGRVLYGGGGIVPDVIIPPDTLTSAEQHVVAILRRQIETTQATLYALGRDVARTVSPDFATRPEWGGLYATRLRGAGIAISPALADSANTFLSGLVAQRVAEIAFGDSAVFRRQSVHDAQLHRALDLLRESPNVSALLLAGRRADG